MKHLSFLTKSLLSKEGNAKRVIMITEEEEEKEEGGRGEEVENDKRKRNGRDSKF